MKALKLGAARLVRDQSGYSLPELLTVMAVLPIVLSAVLLFTEKAQLSANNDTERSHTIRETQVGLDRMTRELRQAHTLVGPLSGYRVEFYVGALNTRVVHDCNEADPADAALKRCVRYEIAADGTETARKPLIGRVVNQASGAASTPVFTYTPTPGDPTTAKHVQVKVEVNARGARKEGYRYRVVLDDGVHLRNRDLAN